MLGVPKACDAPPAIDVSGTPMFRGGGGGGSRLSGRYAGVVMSLRRDAYRVLVEKGRCLAGGQDREREAHANLSIDAGIPVGVAHRWRDICADVVTTDGVKDGVMLSCSLHR